MLYFIYILMSQQKKNADILLIDCVGILTEIYSYANIAYVGGGMGTKGLHNTLEPAVFRTPILIGENYMRFQEAQDLVALGGIISVDSSSTFEILKRCFAVTPIPSQTRIAGSFGLKLIFLLEMSSPK